MMVPAWSTPLPALVKTTTTIAMRYGFDVLSPMDNKGYFTEEIPGPGPGGQVLH